MRIDPWLSVPTLRWVWLYRYQDNLLYTWHIQLDNKKGRIAPTLCFGNPAIEINPQQIDYVPAGFLKSIRGFPSPPYDGFGFIA